MITGDQLKLDDHVMITNKIDQRRSQHAASAKYKARGKVTEKLPVVNIGDIVYLYIDRSKSRSRDKYLVTEVEGQYAWVQKMVGKSLRSRKYRVNLVDIINVPTKPIYSAEFWRKSKSKSEDITADLKPVPTGS